MKLLSYFDKHMPHMVGHIVAFQEYLSRNAMAAASWVAWAKPRYDQWGMSSANSKPVPISRKCSKHTVEGQRAPGLIYSRHLAQCIGWSCYSCTNHLFISMWISVSLRLFSRRAHRSQAGQTPARRTGNVPPRVSTARTRSLFSFNAQ